MPTVTVYTTDGAQAGDMELSDVVFAAQINENLLHDAVVAHLANCRQGTQSALTRAEVRGGGIKPFRQKGTGRARQGSSRSPQYEGGGVVFAPKPRDYSKKLNKKVRRAALRSALSSKLADENVVVVEQFDLEAPKTKEMVRILENLAAGNALIVTDAPDVNVVRSASNLPGVKTAVATALSVYDILSHDKFVVTKDAVRKIEEVFGE